MKPFDNDTVTRATSTIPKKKKIPPPPKKKSLVQILYCKRHYSIGYYPYVKDESLSLSLHASRAGAVVAFSFHPIRSKSVSIAFVVVRVPLETLV